MKKWKVAMAGVGNWPQTMYLPQMARVRQAELVALCARTEEKLNAVADRFGVPERYTDYREMLRRCDFDILMNITPIQLHHEINMAAMRAGKHVYSQKPFALTVAEATEQIETARAMGVRLSCAPVHLLRPSIRKARNLIRKGAIGKVTFARISCSHGGPEYFQFRDEDPSWFYRPGAGALMDMGVHALDQLTAVLGPAKELFCMATIGEPERTIRSGALDGRKIKADMLPDSYIISLDFGGGTIGVADTGFFQKAGKRGGFEIYGTQGTISFEAEGEGLEVYIDRPELGLRGWLKPMAEEEPEEFFQCRALEDLIEALENHRPVGLPPEHARHVIEMMERIPDSIREKRAVSLATRF